MHVPKGLDSALISTQGTQNVFILFCFVYLVSLLGLSPSPMLNALNDLRDIEKILGSRSNTTFQMFLESKIEQTNWLDDSKIREICVEDIKICLATNHFAEVYPSLSMYLPEKLLYSNEISMRNRGLGDIEQRLRNSERASTGVLNLGEIWDYLYSVNGLSVIEWGEVISITECASIDNDGADKLALNLPVFS